MLVEKTERTPADLSRVSLDEEWEAQYWCARFDATPEEIRACVQAVGPRTEDVERQLRKAGKDVLKNTGED